MAIPIPEKMKKIMREFNLAGYAAYVVGGAVRDMILGREPKDYDFATDAKPEEIAALAKNLGWKVVDNLGQNFGVVLVVAEGEAVEIAAYRGERYGADSHRPEKVWHADSLEEDLSRRDFTINAMALDLGGKLYDPFGGRDDLDSGIIRTVGLPQNRFAEDALRMFRACRFSAELGFEISPDIFAAIPGQIDRVSGLSMERVRQELQQILLADHPARGLDALVSTGLAGAECRVRSAESLQTIPILPELMHLVGMPQNPRYHTNDVWRHTLNTLQGVPRELVIRWAALLHDVAKGLPGIRGSKQDGEPTDYGHDQAGAGLADEILQRFEYSKHFRKRVSWLVARHMRVTVWDKDGEAIRRWLREEARSGNFRNSVQLAEAFTQLELLGLADAAATGATVNWDLQRSFAGILVSMAGRMPVGTGDLRYQAEMIQPILGDAKLMGPFLKNVLTRVQDGVLENNNNAIAEAARRWIKRHAGEDGDAVQN